MERSPILEVCVESADGVMAAEQGGAHRVELCAALAIGGLTPSIGTLRVAIGASQIPIVVLIRPRAGDFCYSPFELATMRMDIRIAKEEGAFGVAIGAVTPQGEIDERTMQMLMQEAGTMSITCHRAFDMTADPRKSLESLCKLGVHRVLTSGQEESAPRGSALLKELVDRAGATLSVMPGCGIREHNIQEVIAATGAREFHFSANETSDSPMEFRNARASMGGTKIAGEYELTKTDAARVRAVVHAASTHSS